LVERWLRGRERVDDLIDLVGKETGVKASAGEPSAGVGRDRARCQHLLFGVVRHFSRLEEAVAALVPRSPRPRLRAVLLLAGFELLDVTEGDAAKIVHHAVEQAKALLSPAEVRLVNAVLRKLAMSSVLKAGVPAADAAPEALARHFSHPEWLVRRWLAQFGAAATRRLLEWNQMPAPVHARWRPAPGGGEAPPAWLQAGAREGFFMVPSGHWPEVEQLLAAGRLYLQDPATMVAAGLLDISAGETVLDLCAAPGGKSLLVADILAERSRSSGNPAAQGRVVAVELPEPSRIERLKANLAKAEATDVALVQADVLQLSPHLLKEHGLPSSYAAVLLDAPCSNTGVMRHRADVKWRLRDTDIAKHAAQQVALLSAAARFAAPGGRIVYSTCSLEAEENEGVVESFLRNCRGRFALEESRLVRPWEAGCDGAGAFRLRRQQ